MSSKLSSTIRYKEDSFDPVKMTIGNKPINLIEQADNLLQEIRAGQVNKSNLDQAILEYCQNVKHANPLVIPQEWESYIENSKKYDGDCVDNLQLSIKNLGNNHITGKFSGCIDQAGQRDFISSVFLPTIDFFMPSDDSSCILSKMGPSESSGLLLHQFTTIAEEYYTAH